MTKTRKKSKTKQVDDVLEEWKVARPDLDPTPIRVFTDAFQTGRLVQEFYETSAARSGILGTDFFLLAELRRLGEPFECTPGDLSGQLVKSSGGMTKQIDRIEAAGLLKRADNPVDRRSSLISLTPKGKRLIDKALEQHFKAEAEILSDLDPSEIEICISVLRSMAEGIRRDRK